MANQKILDNKKQIVEEIKNKLSTSTTSIVFNYNGLTDEELKKLRRELKESSSDFKIYKNTLAKRAVNDLKIPFDEHLEGPRAIAFSNDVVGVAKSLGKFAENTCLEIEVGYVDGSLVDVKTIQKYATIPSREGLLTMLAGGMIGIVRDLSCCLHLYGEQKEENK